MSKPVKTKISLVSISSFIKQITKKGLFFPVCIILLTLPFYIRNISPSAYGGDTGDFLAAAVTKGVPHPSGYPLYTIFGRLALLLPTTSNPALKVGLVSAVFSSLSALIYYLIFTYLLKNRLISFISTMTLAYTYTFWLYAEIAEVFSLNSFFILILIYLSIRYLENKTNNVLYLITFFTGLSLTNNLSIILVLLPIWLGVIFSTFKIFLNIKLLLKLALIFLLGLLPYIYIPIAASKNPYMNWGNVNNLENFINLVLRKEYGWYAGLGYDWSYVLTQLKTYIVYNFSYVSPLVFLFSILGIIFLLLRKNYRMAILFLSIYILTGPFYIIYSRAPIQIFGDFAVVEKFYLASIISLMMFYPYGLLLIDEIIYKLIKKSSLKRYIRLLTLFVFAVIPTALFITNLEKTNFSDCFIGDNLGRDILESVPQNSILLLSDDSMSFNSIYVQQTYNLREDVEIPGKHNNFSVLFDEAKIPKSYVGGFVNEFKSFNTLAYPLIVNAMKTRDIYSAEKLDIKIPNNENENIVAVPHGLIFKLERVNHSTASKEEYLDNINQVLNKYHINELNENQYLTDNNFALSHIRRIYAYAYINISKYVLEKYDDKQKSIEYAKKAFEIDPLLQEDMNN